METKNIRNICLIGHGNSGKTSQAESMLYVTGAIDRMGKGSDGNTVGDYDANGVVDVRDVVLLTRWIHGEKVTLAKTDVVADGVTDTFDLAMLKRIVTKK